DYIKIYITWSGARHRDHRAPSWASTVSRRLPEANSKICSFPLCDRKHRWYKDGAEGVFTGHGADHLQSRPVSGGGTSNFHLFQTLTVSPEAERTARLSELKAMVRTSVRWPPMAVGLHRVVLQQQRHLQLAARTRQAVHPSKRRGRRRSPDDLVFEHLLHHRLPCLLCSIFLSSATQHAQGEQTETILLTGSSGGLHSLCSGVLPGDQEVLVSEEQSLCDDVFVSPQPVQTTLIDDVPHNHICVLQEEEEGEVIGAGDEPSSQSVVLYHCDCRLVAVEGDVALAIHQVEDSHGAVLVAHGDVDAIR
ncbi:hypothetical protein INR49_026945, partial [Caranx melampygus]